MVTVITVTSYRIEKVLSSEPFAIQQLLGGLEETGRHQTSVTRIKDRESA